MAKSYLRHMPNMTVMAPATLDEFERMLEFAVNIHNGPVAIRYPKENGIAAFPVTALPVISGRSVRILKGNDLTFVSIGTMLETAVKTAEELKARSGLSVDVINARFVKPLDIEMIVDSVRKTGNLVSFEENVTAGGFGSAIMEMFSEHGIPVRVMMIGINDKIVPHGSKKEIKNAFGLTPEAIAEKIALWLEFYDKKQT
jgi:1-deoxy-D-xylulose-5-phosphate synthase